MFLRVVVFFVCSYYAVAWNKKNKEKEAPAWVWGLGGLALLFNPFFPAHLTREIWMFFNIVGGVFLLKVAGWKDH